MECLVSPELPQYAIGLSGGFFDNPCNRILVIKTRRAPHSQPRKNESSLRYAKTTRNSGCSQPIDSGLHRCARYFLPDAGASQALGTVDRRLECVCLDRHFSVINQSRIKLGLACIAHKFLDRPATLRPPASLREALRARRSDAGGEFVSDAGSGSGILRLRRTIPLLFGEKILKAVCFS